MNQKRPPTQHLAKLLLCFLVAACQLCAGDNDALLDPFFSTHFLQEVSISPDGRKVAWVQMELGKGNQYSKNVYVACAQRGCSPQVVDTFDDADRYGLAWSPDSEHLTFIVAAPDRSPRLAIADTDVHRIRTLGELTGVLSSPHWSPDGQYVSVLRDSGTKSQSEDVDKVHILVHPEKRHQQVVLLSADSGTIREVTPSNLFVYEYDWAPDGKVLAVTAAPAVEDNRWWTAQLYTVNVESGRPTLVYKPELQIAYPKWSPDGKYIALIGGLMSDFIAPGGDLYLIETASGVARNLTAGLKSSVTWVGWQASSRVLTAEIVDGEGQVASIGLQNGTRQVLWQGTDAPFATQAEFNPFGFSLAISRDGQMTAGVRTSFDRAPEVWSGPIGKWQQITHVNEQAKRTWGKAKSLHWTSEGRRLQGWLLYPSEFSSARKYPLVTVVHGGPASAALAHWGIPFDNAEVLSQLGYFVFYPNPRGSMGLGERFTQGNVKDLGYGDLRDIESGVREILRIEPVDPKRVGITGWSYGGYMAMWAVTQTDLFKASVAGPGISDWTSYYGQVDIEQWMLPYFGTSLYKDPGIYARSSPVLFAGKARAPTFMYVGGQDSVCPPAQSLEFWRALKRFGVETDLLLFPNEGHRISQPADQRRVTREMVRWFGEHLK